MNISPFALSVIVLGLLVWGISDFMRADEAEVVIQGDCDPAKTQVIHMDNSNQITQVLDRGVTCIVVMRGLK